jgi:beta-carotene ketolase (CrtW type)
VSRTITSRNRTVASLTFAALIMLTWSLIHVGGIFFWRWDPTTAVFAAALVLLQTWLSTGLFIIAHDCMHGSLAPGHPRVNRVIGTLCLGAYAGLSYAALCPKHHAHHALPGTADDPDFHPGAPSSLLPWLMRFFRTYYTHGQLLRIALAAGLYLLLGASLINIVMFWAIPALLALLQLFVFGTFLPHRHDRFAFADHHNARSMRLSPIASLFTCFHFGGYHHEHHLHPGVPWWRLPSARRGETPD